MTLLNGSYLPLSVIHSVDPLSWPCSDMQMFDRVRGQDINILKMFGVKYIVDLMVEKKKVKFGMK